MKKIQLTEAEVNTILEENDFKVEYINFQNNSINGAIYKDNKKHFFKIMTKERCKQELEGYEKIKIQYSIPKLIENLTINNVGILLYEYDESISRNEGLLHDFILNIERKEDYRKNVIYNIFKYYDNSLKTLKKVNTYPMQEFYDKRINTRLIKWYKNWEINEYTIIINEKFTIKLSEIIIALEKFFKSNKEYLAFLSQGDPNTLNIGIKPVFMDLTTSGYNYVGAEIAAFTWSELVADVYFCPKYHQKSYKNHENILESYWEYEPNLEYMIDREKKIINIKGKLRTSKIRKDILYQYIDIFKKNNIEIKDELKYYIIMRILCIFNIREMEEIDTMYSILCIVIVFNLLENNKNSLDMIKILLKEYTEEVEI